MSAEVASGRTATILLGGVPYDGSGSGELPLEFAVVPGASLEVESVVSADGPKGRLVRVTVGGNWSPEPQIIDGAQVFSWSVRRDAVEPLTPAVWGENFSKSPSGTVGGGSTTLGVYLAPGASVRQLEVTVGRTTQILPGERKVDVKAVQPQ